MAHVAKKLVKAREGIDRVKLYPIDDAVKLVKERASAKFDETVEIAMNLGVDPKHADQMVRGVVNLPNGTGRTLKVAVFARGAKADEAKAAGADIVGAEELVTMVQGGTIDFDRCIATPDMMPLVGRLGKVLGPRGMMPNPKVGTVTMDVTGGGQGLERRRGRVPGREGRHHAGQRRQGVVRCRSARRRTSRRSSMRCPRPSRPGAKGTYIQRMAISSTMGPGVKVDPSSVAAGRAFVTLTGLCVSGDRQKVADTKNRHLASVN